MNLKNLKFIDFEQNKIAENKIDTTFLISKNIVLNFAISDTFKYIVYNNAGNIVYDSGRPFSGAEIYKYDDNGFVRYKTVESCMPFKYTAIYQYLPQKNLLKQYWIFNGKASNLCFYTFDNQGRQSEMVEYNNYYGAYEANFQTIFDYDTVGHLQKKTKLSLNNDSLNENFQLDLNYKIITRYFYTNNSIDSSITEDYYKSNPREPYISKTYFDANGLKINTLSQYHYPHGDGTYDIYQKNIKISRDNDRDTLEIKYIHKKRKK